MAHATRSEPVASTEDDFDVSPSRLLLPARYTPQRASPCHAVVDLYAHPAVYAPIRHVVWFAQYPRSDEPVQCPSGMNSPDASCPLRKFNNDSIKFRLH